MCEQLMILCRGYRFGRKF